MNGEGICFIERCPRCLKASEFRYTVGRVALFGKKFIIRLTCSNCRTVFQNDEAGEGEKLRQIAEITQAISDTDVPVEEGMKRIEAIGSEVYAGIVSDGRTWICESCGEENYLSVGECWRCHTEHPDMAGLQVDEEVDETS